MALIKTPQQQADLREAGKHLKQVFEQLKTAITPGVTTDKLDQIAAKIMRDLGTKPSFLHYSGFPKSTCISINDQVIHGIPSAEIVLQAGDILTIDAGLWYKDVCVDAARSFTVGETTKEAQRLLRITKEALAAGVAAAKPGNHIGEISTAIQHVADENGMGIVRNYTGHGVGTSVHEEPSIPNYGQPGDGIIIEPGMVLAIEPMFTLGGGEVITLSDGWTVITNDGSLAAQFEHTVLVTAKGPEVIV